MFPEKFPSKPRTLHSFMSFLEKQNQVNILFANYKVERKTVTTDGVETWQYVMTAEQECVFSITQKFGKAKNSAKPTRETIGALLDHARVKASTVVRPLTKFMCPVCVGELEVRRSLRVSEVTFKNSHLNDTHCRYDEKERMVKPALWSLFVSMPIRVAKGNLLQLL